MSSAAQPGTEHSPSLDELPEDVLLEVITALLGPRRPAELFRLVGLAGSCRRLREVCGLPAVVPCEVFLSTLGPPQYWSTMHKGASGTIWPEGGISPPAAFFSGWGRGAGVAKVVVDVDNVPSDLWKYLSDLGVKSLDFRATDCMENAAVALAEALPRFRNVEDVANSGAYFHALSDKFMSSLGHCRSLTRLDISSASSVTDSGLASLASGCPMLQFLSVKGCVKVTDRGVAAMLTQAGGLTDLDCTCTNVTDNLVPALNRHQNLTRLNISACPMIGTGIKALRIRGLRSLSLHANFVVTGEDVASVAEQCPGLEYLDLFRCKSVDDQGLHGLANFTKGIRSLIIDELPLISDSGIHSLVKCCPMLTELDMSNCEGLGAESLLSLGRHAHSLEKISMRRSLGVSDCNGVRSLAFLPRLTTLDLHSSRVSPGDLGELIEKRGSLLDNLALTRLCLTDAVLLSLSSHATSLRVLSLSMNRDISNTGVKALAKCSRLEDLDLSFCLNVGDEGVVPVAESCKRLRIIKLDRCSRVTDRFLRQLGQTCPALTTVSLAFDTRLSHGGVQSLLAGCPSLSYVDISGVLDEEEDDDDVTARRIIAMALQHNPQCRFEGLEGWQYTGGL